MVPVLIGLGIAAAAGFIAGSKSDKNKDELNSLMNVITKAAKELVRKFLAFLGWDRIIDWFKGKQRLKESDKDNVAFTIQQAYATGNFNTIQGIFNKRTNTFPDLDAGMNYEAEDVDDKLKKVHKTHALVIYE